MQLKQVYRG